MQARIIEAGTHRGPTCRTIGAPWFLALIIACALVPVHLAAQERTSASTSESRLDASISVDSNHGGNGSWLQVTPGVGYTFTPFWRVEAGVPLYYLSAGATYDGTSATSSVGDVYGSLSLDLSSDAATFYTTVTVSAPTGSEDKGLSAGQVSWDWTTHLAEEFGRLGPYVSGGFANNLKTANKSLGQSAGTGRAGTAVSTGELGHAEAGLEVTLWKSLTLTGSGYGVFAVQGQAAATPVVRSPRPGARNPWPGAAARRAAIAAGAVAAAAVEDSVSDHGLGLVLWDQVTPSLDLSLWISHSLAYSNYTVVSISATFSLKPQARSERPGSGQP